MLNRHDNMITKISQQLTCAVSPSDSMMQLTCKVPNFPNESPFYGKSTKSQYCLINTLEKLKTRYTGTVGVNYLTVHLL